MSLTRRNEESEKKEQGALTVSPPPPPPPPPVEVVRNVDDAPRRTPEEILREKNLRLSRELAELKKKVAEDRKEKWLNYICNFEIPFDEIKKLRQIGAGGQGKVFVADWQGSGGYKKVALKEVKVDGVCTRENFFDLEVHRAINELHHPNFVKIYGFSFPKAGTELESPIKSYWIIMELMEGDVRTLTRDFNLGIDKKIKIMYQMAQGINYMHKKRPEKIIHHDIKCENFLFKDMGNIVKVADLGVSRAISGGRTKKGNVSFTVFGMGGTWRWDSPEIIQYRRDHDGENEKEYVSEKSDVWALGMAFYEVLTGRKPFEYEMRNPDVTKDTILNRILDKKNWRYGKGGNKPFIEKSIRKGTPNFILNILNRCWDEPENRPTVQGILNYFREKDVFGVLSGEFAKDTKKKKKKKDEKEEENEGEEED